MKWSPISWFPRAAVIHESGSGLEPNVESVMGQVSVISTQAFTSVYNCMGSVGGGGGGGRVGGRREGKAE